MVSKWVELEFNGGRIAFDGAHMYEYSLIKTPRKQPEQYTLKVWLLTGETLVFRGIQAGAREAVLRALESVTRGDDHKTFEAE